MREIYGQETAQRLGDARWIQEMTERDLVLFSKDARIKTVHQDAVVAARAKVFLLPDQGIRADHMIARYVTHKYRIAARARKDGPYVYMVRPKALERFRRSVA